MALNLRSMTFATVITLHLQREFAGAYKVPYIWTASVPMHESPKKPPLMLPAPPKSTGGTEQKKTRVKNPREPGKYDVVIYNTERMPADYVCGMLQRVFREGAETALVRSLFERHIHQGPFTRDVAETKAQQVRTDAFEHSAPIPEVRYDRR